MKVNAKQILADYSLFIDNWRGAQLIIKAAYLTVTSVLVFLALLTINTSLFTHFYPSFFDDAVPLCKVGILAVVAIEYQKSPETGLFWPANTNAILFTIHSITFT